MRIKIIGSLLLIHFIMFTGLAQYNKTIEIADFNNDKVMDTLHSQYDGGSTFGGTYVSIVNGKTNEVFKLNNHGCNCQMIHFIDVPKNLTLKKNKFFFDVLKKKLLSKEEKKIDTSLQWILNGLNANKELDDNPYFSLIIDPKPKWERKKRHLLKSYYLQLSTDSLRTLIGHDTYKNEFNESSDSIKILSYFSAAQYFNKSYSNKLSELPLVASSKTYEIYKTAHGVLAKKGRKHKWLFITTPILTGAPDKLRWDSIGKISLLGDYLVVQQNTPPTTSYNIYVINIKTGLTGKLKFEIENSIYDEKSDSEIDNTYLIENGRIIFRDYYNKITEIQLHKIFDELEKAIYQK